MIAIGIHGQQPMHFEQITIEDGLSHNTVQSLIQDHYGYVWIGTQNGLNKYDGYNIKHAGSQAIAGKIITALFEDSQRNLWVGTRNNGVFVKPAARADFFGPSAYGSGPSLETWLAFRRHQARAGWYSGRSASAWQVG